MKKFCTKCNKQFTPTTSRQIYCGTQKCYLARRKQKTCLVCRKTINNYKYCSGECRVKATKRRRNINPRHKQIIREGSELQGEYLWARAKGEI